MERLLFAVLLLFTTCTTGQSSSETTESEAVQAEFETNIIDASASTSSTIEFGPCTEFIGGYYVPEANARIVVPEKYTLDVSEEGAVVAQVRAINCQSISIKYEDGSTEEGGEHILYQLGAAVLSPVQLDPNPLLVGAAEITEYHAYAYNTLTNFEPLAVALEKAGIRGVHHVENLVFNTGDDNPNGCELVPVEGSVSTPAELALSFSGLVRDLGLEPEDGCQMGPNDVTVSERAVWYTEGELGTVISDTAVPNKQILLFNADPTTYEPLPVTFSPTGEKMQLIGGGLEQFSFTMSGLLERGEVFTTLRLVTEE
ncbi:MAG: hypothetical protein KTR29_16010 [Rhodothermaceae bacterium]|nr:hypothetical protein [Rhodothermaceae bacterium]